MEQYTQEQKRFAADLIRNINPQADTRDPYLGETLLLNLTIQEWLRKEHRPQVTLSDAKSAQSVPFDPLLLSPHTVSYLTGGDFARESLARILLDKTPIFTANLSYEEWIKEVLSKIPLEWPIETKIAIIKQNWTFPSRPDSPGNSLVGVLSPGKNFPSS